MVFFSFSCANPSKKSTKTNKEHDRSNEEDNIYIYTHTHTHWKRGERPVTMRVTLFLPGMSGAPKE
jgi:hypothetical protein